MPDPARMKRRLLVWWAYAVEIMAALGLHLVLGIVFGFGPLASFIQRSARDWATLEGVLLAAALVIWGVYFNFMSSDFGDYLRWDGSERVFRVAFTFAVFIQLVAAVLMIVAANLFAPGSMGSISEAGYGLVHLAFFALLLALINIPTLFTNTLVLLSLRRAFLVEKKKCEDEMKHPPTSNS